MQGWSCVPQEGLRDRGMAFPVVTARLVQLIVKGTMMGLQPMKAKLDPFMANLLGQVDWSPVMKYSGYQVADTSEEEGLTQVYSLEDEDEEEEDDQLELTDDDVSEVVVVVRVVLGFVCYLYISTEIFPKCIPEFKELSLLFELFAFPDGLSLLQEELSLVLPLTMAESAPLRVGTMPFHFCNLLSSATCEQLAPQRRITFGFSNLQYSACCSRPSRSLPRASWQLPVIVELSVLTESLELPEQSILRELLHMKMAWSVMVSSEPLLEYTPGRLQFRMSGLALVKDSDLLPQMLIRCSCSQNIWKQKNFSWRLAIRDPALPPLQACFPRLLTCMQDCTIAKVKGELQPSMAKIQLLTPLGSVFTADTEIMVSLQSVDCHRPSIAYADDPTASVSKQIACMQIIYKFNKNFQPTKPSPAYISIRPQRIEVL